MALTPQEVGSKVFSPTRLRRGYDENEVDAFLDQVEAEINRLTSENERLRQELEKARRERRADDGGGAVSPSAAADPGVPTPIVEAAPSPPAPTPDEFIAEQGVARMLVLAQRTADAAVREAKADADHTRGSARLEAERVLAEARTRSADEMGHLERNKTVLETEVDQLQEFEREYRRRMRAYLEMQLRDLELGTTRPAAVEGRSVGALNPGTSAGFRQESDQSVPAPSLADRAQAYDPDPLMTGRSEATGSGPVRPPAGGGAQEADPQVGAPAEAAGQRPGWPFDTGSDR
jgi:DivIVA domain-containing protein